MYDYDTASRTIFTLFCHQFQNFSRHVSPSRAGEDLVGSMCHRLFRLMKEQPNLLARLGHLGDRALVKSSPILIQFWHFGIFWGIILIIYVILPLLLLLLLLLLLVNHNNESPWPLNQTALVGAEAGVNSSCGRSAMAWYIKADAVAAFCVVEGQSLLADLGLTILLFGKIPLLFHVSSPDLGMYWSSVWQGWTCSASLPGGLKGVNGQQDWVFYWAPSWIGVPGDSCESHQPGGGVCGWQWQRRSFESLSVPMVFQGCGGFCLCVCFFWMSYLFHVPHVSCKNRAWKSPNAAAGIAACLVSPGFRTKHLHGVWCRSAIRGIPWSGGLISLVFCRAAC